VVGGPSAPTISPSYPPARQEVPVFAKSGGRMGDNKERELSPACARARLKPLFPPPRPLPLLSLAPITLHHTAFPGGCSMRRSSGSLLGDGRTAMAFAVTQVPERALWAAVWSLAWFTACFCFGNRGIRWAAVPVTCRVVESRLGRWVTGTELRQFCCGVYSGSS
jgi:hypothetical protein